MIFESVGYITNKEEFTEKILVYIRLVEVLAERENIRIPKISIPSGDMIKEMKDMGVIQSEADLTLLKKSIAGNYDRFLSALSFYLTNRHLYGNQLDKLCNKKLK